jgi:hypothetical protein
VVAKHRIFSTGLFKGWDAMLAEVAAFATALGPPRVISISHNEINVIVWYWESPASPAGASAQAKRAGEMP